MTGGFPSQKTSNAESVSRPWRHHQTVMTWSCCDEAFRHHWLEQRLGTPSLPQIKGELLSIRPLKLIDEMQLKLSHNNNLFIAGSHLEVKGQWIKIYLNSLSSVLNLFVYVFVNAFYCIMTSSNGNIFRVTGPFCGEFTGEFLSQRPVTRNFEVLFDLRLNKRLSIQSWGCLFEVPLRSLWRHCNENGYHFDVMDFIEASRPACKTLKYCNTSLKTWSCHNANFVITGIIRTTWGATDDDKVVFMATFCFQCFNWQVYQERHRIWVQYIQGTFDDHYLR